MKNNICSYKNHDYKTKFWEGDVNRNYEHNAELIAINKLLDEHGDSIIDLGAGFGRLVEIYIDKYKKEIVLFDYAENLLDEAKKTIEKRKYNNVRTAQGSLYELPFLNETFSAAISVRVLHHIENVSQFLREVNRILKRDAVFVLEYANKRNLLEILRSVFGKSQMKPLSKETAKRGEGLYFNFHPAYIREEVEKAGFKIEDKLSVSNFRAGILKKIIPLKVLLFFENILQRFLSKITFGPSIFLKLRKIKEV